MDYINLDAYKVISLDKISSTQDYAHDLIVSGNAVNKTVITATAQSSGRGRYRRTWVSHHGNLYVSFIYKIEDKDPRLSYAIGVAVAETLNHFGIDTQIKWPNDILVNGKKISGILIEYTRSFVVIGIGINVKTSPTIKNYETTKTNLYTDASVTDILSVLIKKIDKWHNSSFENVRHCWMNMAMSINNTIVYHGIQMELIGLNLDGALILRNKEKYILTYADEIFV